MGQKMPRLKSHCRSRKNSISFRVFGVFSMSQAERNSCLSTATTTTATAREKSSSKSLCCVGWRKIPPPPSFLPSSVHGAEKWHLPHSLFSFQSRCPIFPRVGEANFFLLLSSFSFLFFCDVGIKTTCLLAVRADLDWFFGGGKEGDDDGRKKKGEKRRGKIDQIQAAEPSKQDVGEKEEEKNMCLSRGVNLEPFLPPVDSEKTKVRLCTILLSFRWQLCSPVPFEEEERGREREQSPSRMLLMYLIHLTRKGKGEGERRGRDPPST